MVILAKLLKELGVTTWLGHALSPLMGLLGLPGSMGLVWATAMLTNLYGGLAVFATLGPDARLTVAQVTVLATVMLVAHNLPVELRIAQRAGPRLRFSALLRILGAFALGIILDRTYALGGFLQRPNVALWNPRPSPPGLGAWALDQAESLATIFLIILALVLLLKVMERIGLTALIGKALEPLLRLLGVSRTAAPLTVIGMTMGLAYGGGLIIEEARSGRMTEKDVFYSLALLGLCHSLIEDTLVMATLGAHHSGILWGRMAFTLAAVYAMVRIVERIPTTTFHRFFLRP